MPSRLFALILLAVFAGALPARADDKPDDLAKLKGIWRVEATVFNGVPVEAEKLKDRTMEFDGKELVPVVGKDKKKALTVTVDAAKTPKEIDLKNPEKDQPGLGIYELTGDELKLCYGEPGAARPTEMKSEAGSRVFYLVLKREKEKK
jgi:uncharacterized protein (TIGR03067 family)